MPTLTVNSKCKLPDATSTTYPAYRSCDGGAAWCCHAVRTTSPPYTPPPTIPLTMGDTRAAKLLHRDEVATVHCHRPSPFSTTPSSPAPPHSRKLRQSHQRNLSLDFR